MIFILTWVAGLIVGLITSIANPNIHTFGELCTNLLFYQLTVSISLSGLIGFWGHVFKSDMVAEQIGWAKGSPFQKELGYAELGYTIAGIMCIWHGKEFWLATIVLVTPLFILAGINHIREMVINNNFHPHNAVTSIPDLFMPLSWIILWIFSK
ncbi:MAG TPA: DUF6790 family protein [Ruminiclostridium sp.]|nr:DUF6790 family protein [Ruminiclostridium sp.]